MSRVFRADFQAFFFKTNAHITGIDFLLYQSDQFAKNSFFDKNFDNRNFCEAKTYRKSFPEANFAYFAPPPLFFFIQMSFKIELYFFKNTWESD